MITYDLLKEALQALGTDDAKQAIVEIDELMQLDAEKQIWHNECFIIPAFTADNFMVDSTYDVYDRLFKANSGGTVTFDEYSAAVRKQTLSANMVSTSMMQLGYDTVESLHADNQNFNSDAQPCKPVPATFEYLQKIAD